MVTSHPLLQRLLLIPGRCVLSSGPVFVWFGTVLRSGQFFRSLGIPLFLPGCLFQFGAPYLMQSTLLNLLGFSFSGFWLFLLLSTCFICVSSESRDSFTFSYIYSWIVSVIASTDMSPFLIFFFSSLSPVVFPTTEKNFEASNSAAVISSIHNFFFDL